MTDVPLVIEFAPQTSLYRERDLVSHLPIIRNGPAGTFVVFPNGVKVSLPTDQIVFADDAGGAARVGFGGMKFTGAAEGRLNFVRVRDLLPEDQLSPARSHVMTLDVRMVSSILVDGLPVWRQEALSPQQDAAGSKTCGLVDSTEAQPDAPKRKSNGHHN